MRSFITCPLHQVKEDEMDRSCSTNGGKPGGRRPLGRPRPGGVDNIKINHREIGCGGMDWIDLGPVEGSCEHGNEPSGSMKCWEILERFTTAGFSRRSQLQEVSQCLREMNTDGCERK
jgi:hypothetical protein